MTSVAVDQLVRENVILINDNPTRFFEEKEHLQAALKYMEEDNGVWKFKSTVPTANAMNMKNRLGMDNARMKRIASAIMRKENSITKGDQTRKWVVIGVTAFVVGGAIWWLFFRRKRNALPPFETRQEQQPSVFDTILKKPKRIPRKVVKKMVVEEFDDNIDIDDEGLNDEGEEA